MSGNYNWVLTLNPRGQILRMNAPRKALIAWNFGDKMIALETRSVAARKTRGW